MKNAAGKRVLTIALCGSLMAGQGVYAAEEPLKADAALAGASVAVTEYRNIVDSRVDMSDVNTSVAGVSVSLDDYYMAYESGEVSKSATIALATMTSSEVASVLENYQNLGVADVESYLNVREEPDGAIIGKMIRYSGCEILDEEGDWYKIKSGPVTGYVSKEFILTGEDAKIKAIEMAKLRAVVTAESNLNVREQPTTESNIITKICSEERYDVLEEADGWVKIALEGADDDAEEGYGYISAEYADVRYALIEAYEFSPLTGSTGLRNSVVNFAMNYLGNRYVWGGTSLTNGADCSGFVMSIFANYGIYLPRVAAAQAGVGTRVDSSEMLPGDLVFYSSGGGIDHVALYIGNGQIIHAANSRRGIIISPWNYMSPTKIMNVIGSR